jgi:hypothetical protein
LYLPQAVLLFVPGFRYQDPGGIVSIGIPQHLAAFGRASPKHPPIFKALVYGEDLVAAPSCKFFDGIKSAEG